MDRKRQALGRGIVPETQPAQLPGNTLVVAPTHAELVALAARWLHGTMKCTLVVTERHAPGTDEIPDAIGWTTYDGQRSVLVECKVSLEDWSADRQKPSRAGSAGMGRERWYLTPPGLLAGRELAGWGWAVVHGGRVYRRAEPLPRLGPEVRVAEYPLLLAVARRALQGIRDGCSIDAAELAGRAQRELFGRTSGAEVAAGG